MDGMTLPAEIVNEKACGEGIQFLAGFKTGLCLGSYPKIISGFRAVVSSMWSNEKLGTRLHNQQFVGLPWVDVFPGLLWQEKLRFEKTNGSE